MATRRHELRPSDRAAYAEAYNRVRRGRRSLGFRGDETRVAIWMEAFKVSTTERISPWDALLLAVSRRAERVQWVDSVIAELLNQHRNHCAAILRDNPTADVNPDVPPPEVREWMNESRKEEQLMARASAMAIQAGVADAMVRRMENEGRLVTQAMVAGLDALELSGEQRLKALHAMHSQLNSHAPSRQVASIPGVVNPTTPPPPAAIDDAEEDES